MTFDYFIEGPLLWIAFLLFIVGISTRVLFFCVATIRGSKAERFSIGYLVGIFTRIFFPFHKSFSKKD